MIARLLLAVVVLLFVFAPPVEGCMRGGISGQGAMAIIALCVVFSPILIVGGAGYFSVTMTKYAVQQTKSKVTYRKRTSNLIKKQRNRMVKKVGAQKFDAYVQELFNKCKENPDPNNYLELGTALFLNNDITSAYHWLTEALAVKGENWNKLGQAYFVRGTVNQYLADYEHAILDFDAASKELPKSVAETQDGATDASKLPQLIAADALNARGYTKMQHALYHDDYQDSQVTINLLHESVDDITAAINAAPEIQGMYFHNRGYCRYHRSTFMPKPSEELQLALDDYDTAISSRNFGTTAEAHAMKAQTLARLDRLPEAQEEAKIAAELDPKVFLVDLTDAHQLTVPWPLPRDKYRNQNIQHVFQETTFIRPHFCDHCSELISMGKGHTCYSCNIRVHKHCHPKVKGKDCWGKLESEYITKMENSEDVSEIPHTHQLKEVHFRKPTWCNLCAGFVASPLGKQGFQCTTCGMKMHKDCKDLLGAHFIV